RRGWCRPAIPCARRSSTRAATIRRSTPTARCACWWSAAARARRCSARSCRRRCCSCPRRCATGCGCRCSTAATMPKRCRRSCARPASRRPCSRSSTMSATACAKRTWSSPAPAPAPPPTCWRSGGRRSSCRCRTAARARSSAATPRPWPMRGRAGTCPSRNSRPKRWPRCWRTCSARPRACPRRRAPPPRWAGRTPPRAWPTWSNACSPRPEPAPPRTASYNAAMREDPTPVPAPLRDDADVLLVGGGHNGLVCAAYLAAAGLKVTVLERRGVVGGAAVTEEFHPGFRNSTASYTVSLLDPEVIAELRLAEHGLRVVERPYANFLPLPDGGAFRLGDGHTAVSLQSSPRDIERLAGYGAMLDRVVAVLRELMQRTPPNLGEELSLADWLASYDVAKRLRHLDLRGRRDLLDLFTKSAGELLDHWFESEPLKAALGWDSVVGNFASPYTPVSAYVLLHHVFGQTNGKPGVWGHAI